MKKNRKEVRLEMMGEIYDGQGVITDLKEKFGEDIYNDVLHFLSDKKFIQIAESFPLTDYERSHTAQNGMAIIRMSGDPKKWGLTTFGIEYYENEMENKQAAPAQGHVINATNSNVSLDSSNVNQQFKITQSNLTPEVIEILEQLRDAIESNDESKKEEFLQNLKNGAENVFWNIVASGIVAATKVNGG